MPKVRIAPADPADGRVQALIDLHHSAARKHYAEEDCHALSAADLVAGGVQLFAAWDGETILAIAGLKPLDASAVELKSMFAAPAARGRGVAALLLSHLSAAARDGGFARMMLEAGRSDDYAAPARALYARAGFAECPPFGTYEAREASIFMSRDV